MNSVRKWIRDIFGFSGSEINGFLILIPVTVLVIVSAPLYMAWVASVDPDDSGDQTKLDSLVAAWNGRLPPMRDATPGIANDSLFSFDPNTAPEQTLQLLGISSRLARRIVAYREKGGVFRIKADLLKIYGLDSTLYKQLFTFISLPVAILKPLRQEAQAERGNRNAGQHRKPFDLNSADTVTLKRIFGIGPTLSARIVKFRDGLGGFLRKEQLFEVYGLDSAVVLRLMQECFIEESFIPVKININAADEKQLSAHPYIRSRNARALLTYRFQHGDFKDLKDIKSLPAIAPEESERFLPYLKVDH